jgi:hypothetical protein
MMMTSFVVPVGAHSFGIERERAIADKTKTWSRGSNAPLNLLVDI